MQFMTEKYLLCDSLKHYKVIEFPYFPFRNLAEGQAKADFDWFVSVIPERLEILSTAIRSQNPAILDELDYTPESLVPLAQWLSLHAHTRKLSEEERRKKIGKIENTVVSEWLEQTVPDWTWTAETISLCFDVGIYLAKVFQDRYENVKWTYVTKPKNYPYANKPILAGFDRDMSPSDLVRVCLAKMRDKTAGPEELKRIYEIWQEKVQPVFCTSLNNYSVVDFSVVSVDKLKHLSPERQRSMKAYFLNSLMAQRVRVLKLAVKSEDATLAKKLDFTIESLIPLGSWLSGHIHIRKLPHDSISKKDNDRADALLQAKLKEPNSDESKLNIESLSLCFDVSAYLGKIIQKKNQKLKWDFIDPRKPVLKGPEVQASVFDTVLASAVSILNKKQRLSGELIEAYKTLERDLAG